MSFSFRIKICGITSEEAARSAVDSGADHLGLIFCPSPRRVTEERAAALMRAVPAAWVGVFAGASPAEVVRTAMALGLSAIQLHGEESPEECRAVRELTGIPVWKALHGEPEGVEEGYEPAVDALLLDARRGGSGRALDWAGIGKRFPASRRIVPLLLAGGLSPENVARAMDEARPDGVDASSRLEASPGVKDPRLVEEFVRRARDARAVQLAGAAP
ncbi:MAG TPA: phosphoribosylanthranilate isomerase [Gemmatimonadota bacterium]|nr:phosphoribosylanthranilate isomerase [Gemmatimonadota bacterium]